MLSILAWPADEQVLQVWEAQTEGTRWDGAKRGRQILYGKPGQQVDNHGYTSSRQQLLWP